MYSLKRPLAYLAACSTIMLVTACGGGGGSGSSKTPSSPPPATQPPAQTLTANAGEDRTVSAGDKVELKAGGTGNITGYQWSRSEGPSVTLSAVDLNAGWFTFIAPSTGTADSVKLTYRLTVTGNGSATAEDSVTITILRKNQAPSATVNAEQYAKGTTTVTLNGSGEDSDGNITAYNWEQVSGKTVEIINADAKQASFVAPSTLEELTLTFRLTVTDNDGATGSADVMIIVTPENAPEIAMHFPPAGGGIYDIRKENLVAFGEATATEADVVSVTLDAGAGPITATLEKNGKWRANNIPMSQSNGNIKLSVEVTDSLGRKETTTTSLQTSSIGRGTGHGWQEIRGLSVDSDANTAYILTSGNRLGDWNLLPISLINGNRGTPISSWIDQKQGPQSAPISHMIYHTLDKVFYVLSDSLENPDDRSLISIDPKTGMRKIVSGTTRGSGDHFEFAIALTQGPANTVFVSDHKAQKVFRVNTSTGNRTTLAHKQTANHNIAGGLGLAWDNVGVNGHLYMLMNTPLGDLLKIDLNRAPVTSSAIGDKNSGPIIDSAASDIVLDPLNNRAFVLKSTVAGILEINLTTGTRKEVAKNFSSRTDRNKGLFFDREKQLLYVADGFLRGELSVIDPETGYTITISR